MEWRLCLICKFLLCEILSFFPRGWWWWTSGTLNIAHKSIHVNNVYKYIVVPYRNKFCFGYIGWGLVDTWNVYHKNIFWRTVWNLEFKFLLKFRTLFCRFYNESFFFSPLSVLYFSPLYFFPLVRLDTWIPLNLFVHPWKILLMFLVLVLLR